MTGFLKFAAVGFVFVLAAQNPDTANQTAESQKDIYAVYSAIISRTSAQSGGTYLIQDRTTGQELFDQARCLQSPSGEEVSQAEILSDYDARKNSSMTVANEFTLPLPYQLDRKSV